jgi:hypothetical protein
MWVRFAKMGTPTERSATQDCALEEMYDAANDTVIVTLVASNTGLPDGLNPRQWLVTLSQNQILLMNASLSQTNQYRAVQN